MRLAAVTRELQGVRSARNVALGRVVTMYSEATGTAVVEPQAVNVAPGLDPKI